MNTSNGETVTKATTGVPRRGTRTTVLNKIAMAKEEGGDVPGVMVLGKCVRTNEAWEVWVLEEADRDGVLEDMNRSSQDIIHKRKLEQVKGRIVREEKRTTALKNQKEAYPQETRMTVRASGWHSQKARRSYGAITPEGARPFFSRFCRFGEDLQ